jgi:hypothetical protein
MNFPHCLSLKEFLPHQRPQSPSKALTAMPCAPVLSDYTHIMSACSFGLYTMTAAILVLPDEIIDIRRTFVIECSVASLLLPLVIRWSMVTDHPDLL